MYELIYNRLPPYKDTFALIEPLLDKTKLNKPWSTAELRLSDEQFRSLNQWISELNAYEWMDIERARKGDIKNANDASGLNVVGLMFFIIFAQQAKRHAKENQLWTSISRILHDSEVRQRFFMSNGQPTVYLKNLLSETAYHWNLRHLFGNEGHQQWFCTIYLQFGFTDWAIDKRLPAWLSGHQATIAVEQLTKSSALASDTFQKIWNGLINYRYNKISEQKCKDLLHASPWVESGQIPILIKQAREKLELNQIEHYNRRYDELPEPQIISEPTLVWSSGLADPVFELCVEAADQFELTEELYEVQAYGVDHIRILRDEHGEYSVLGNGVFTLPFEKSEYEFKLVALDANRTETVVATQSITLWNTEHPASLYEHNGQKVTNPDKPGSLNKGCYLITLGSLAIKPIPINTYTNDENWALHHIPNTLLNEFSISHEGNKIWWPEENDIVEIAKPKFQAKFENPKEWRNSKANTPNIYSIRLRVSDEATINWARYGVDPVNLQKIDENYYCAELEVSAGKIYYDSKITASIQYNGKAHRCEANLEFSGNLALMLNSGKISAYKASKNLNTKLAASALFKLLRESHSPYLEQEGHRDDYLLEGSKVVCRLGTRAINIPNLKGYGEELSVYRGLYNTGPALYTVVDQVADTGCIKKIIINADGINLRNFNQIELSPDHSLYAYNSNKELIELSLTEHPDPNGGFDWFAPHPPKDPNLSYGISIHGFGLFYKKERIGSWMVLTTWSTPLKHPMSREEAMLTAEVLRWFKAPIAAKHHRGNVINFLYHNLGRILPIWLSQNNSLEGNFTAMPIDESWIDIIGALIYESNASSTIDLLVASQIVEGVYEEFRPNALVEDLPVAISRLGSISPFIIQAIIKPYLRNEIDNSNRAVAETTKEALVKNYAYTSLEVDDLCSTMGLDRNFLESCLRKMSRGQVEPSELENHNHALLLSNPVVRRILTYWLIKFIKL